MRNRTLLETLKLTKELKMKEIIWALWRAPVAKKIMAEQIAHGFLVGNVIKPSATIWVKAQGNSEANGKATAVVSEIIDADHFVYVQGGIVPGAYAKGAKYFLSIATAGEVFVQAAPEVWAIGQFRQMIGTGTDGGLLVEIDEGVAWNVFLTDVPNDGKKYVRKFNLWDEFIAITSGLGMDFTGTEVKLGLPSSITATSNNSLTAKSHTHALSDEIKLKLAGVTIKAETTIVKVSDGTIETVIEDGFIYNGNSLLDPRNIAPVGWRVPVNADYDNYITSEGFANSGGKLKEIGTVNWQAPNESATDVYGFKARPGGYRTSGGQFMYRGTQCHLHSLDIDNIGGAGRNGVLLLNNDDLLYSTYNFTLSEFKRIGRTVRLIKEDNIDTGTMTDNDGNVYNTVKVGIKVWMGRNLITKTYRDGSPIPEGADNTAWQLSEIGMRCSYGNDENIALKQTTVITEVKLGGLILIPSKESILNSVTLTGTPTAPTPLAADNSTKLANTAFVKAVIAELINGSATTLDTLNEIALALGNDPNFATTITTLIGTKLNASFSNITDPVAARTALGLGAVAMLASIGITDVAGLTEVLAGKQSTMVAGTDYLTPTQIANTYAPISVLNDIETLLASI